MDIVWEFGHFEENNRFTQDEKKQLVDKVTTSFKDIMDYNVLNSEKKFKKVTEYSWDQLIDTECSDFAYYMHESIHVIRQNAYTYNSASLKKQGLKVTNNLTIDDMNRMPPMNKVRYISNNLTDSFTSIYCDPHFLRRDITYLLYMIGIKIDLGVKMESDTKLSREPYQNHY
jgi:hypothetical protein